MMNLPSVEIGGRLVKYIHFRHPNYFYVGEIIEVTDVPLYLGSDVLAGSSHLPKNYARIHARFANENFAYKLSSQNLKIEGISNSSSLWFYTVQGLFKIAFEYLDLEAQQDCLISLKDVWIMAKPNPGPEGNIELCPLEDYINPNDIFNNPSVVLEEQFLTTENPVDTCLLQGSDTNVHLSDGNIPMEVIQVSLSDEVGQQTTEDLHCDAKDQSEPSLKCLLKCIKDYIRTQKKNLSSNDKNTIDNLMILLRLYECEYLGKEKASGIPFEVFKQYCSLCEDAAAKECFQNEFGIPVKTNIALCLLCEWMGKEFSGLKQAVADKAERFKLEHIDRVHSLPKPETLINTLFPQCMKILLQHWMDSMDTVDVPSPDHTYSPPRKKAAHNVTKTAVYPFIQIILEFANSALVSGVAHVLHTRLLHDNT